MDERDVIDALVQRIDELDKRVKRLENNTSPSLPIYDNTNWPTDAFEGQIVIAPT